MSSATRHPLVLAVIAALATPVAAQTVPSTPAAPPDPAQSPQQAPLPAPLPAPPTPRPATPAAAEAPEDRPPARAWTITPSIALIETYSDNPASVADALARHGWITDLTPGIRVEAAGSRVHGFLDYRLHELRYSSDSALDSRQNFLQSRFTVDAVRDFAFLDARADITQESRSPFGVAPPSGTPTANANRVETTYLQLSPWIRGSAGDFARYQLRARVGEVRTDDGTIPDTRTTEWSGRLASASGGTRVGWSLEGSTLSVRNDTIGTLDDTRLRARLLWMVTPGLRLVLGEGIDETEFAGPPTRREDTPGAGFAWIPSERTQVAALYERRVFGDGYGATVSHRESRLLFRLSSTRDATILPGLTGTDTRSSLADLVSLLIASSSPDPEARASQARHRLEDPSLAGGPVLGSALLSSRPVVYKQTDASVRYQGVRSTFAIRYARLDQREYGASVGDGTPASGAQDLDRRTADATWTYRFTPITTGTLVASHQRTHGLAQGAPDTRQTFLTAALATELGQRATASAGVRRLRFDSTSPDADRRENAVFVQVAVRF